MGYKKLLGILSLKACCLLATPGAAQVPVVKDIWTLKMAQAINEVEKKIPGQVGVYVKRLEDQTEFSHRGSETWYIASGTKLPIAITVLREIDTKKLKLGTKLLLKKEDYVDGAGGTNFYPPDSSLTVRYLLEQMLIHSDNTASDLLIKKVGLDTINTYLKELVPVGFEPITSLATVRRVMYQEVHPSAEHLTGMDFVNLRNIKDESQRFDKLCDLLKIKKDEAKCPTLDKAYKNYYAKNMNSATLKAYGELLEQVVVGNTISPRSQRLLTKIMLKAETGPRRIIAGLPAGYRFAHKTGTQRQRICDFGVIWPSADLDRKKGVIVAACVKNLPTLKDSEALLRQVGEHLVKSGVFL